MKKIFVAFFAMCLMFPSFVSATESPLELPPEPFYLPVLMYHQISENPKRLCEYVISPEAFESDLKLLKELGYQPITTAELLKYAENKYQNVPEKAIMLTFDDGYLSDYVYAFPLLEKYEMKAVFAIVGAFADIYSVENADKNIRYAHTSWAEMAEMNESEFVEFVSHTNDMHNLKKRRGALRKKSESIESYKKALECDIAALNEKFEEHFGETPTALACPFGNFNQELQQALKESGFTVILTSEQKNNILTGKEDELLDINRIVRNHGMDLKKLLDKLESQQTKK
ncbi:MAG: polysaccharide deacetylase family protein [Defluviitaleaceae bacterium]|nr:polysaccharide deacetylase family protein [Defluviitaleaceae bacterium]